MNIRLPKTNKPVVCVLSGGMDSTVLVYALVKKYGNENVKVITFNYGRKHNVELEKSKITCEKLNLEQKIIDISFVGDIVKDVCSLSGSSDIEMPSNDDSKDDNQANFVVPYRNLIFQSIALSYAESLRAEHLFLGIQLDDDFGFWDCRENYYKELNKLTKLNDKYKIKVNVPLLHFSKKDEIILGNKLGVPFEDTWTCYNGDDGDHKACGVCHSCAGRLKAFNELGLKDPLNYK